MKINNLGGDMGGVKSFGGDGGGGDKALAGEGSGG